MSSVEATQIYAGIIPYAWMIKDNPITKPPMNFHSGKHLNTPFQEAFWDPLKYLLTVILGAFGMTAWFENVLSLKAEAND